GNSVPRRQTNVSGSSEISTAPCLRVAPRGSPRGGGGLFRLTELPPTRPRSSMRFESILDADGMFDVARLLSYGAVRTGCSKSATTARVGSGAGAPTGCWVPGRVD